MKVYVIGNPLVKDDSLPFKFLPKLKKTFPKLDFIEADPNENFVPEDGSIIIDTVQGIDDVRWFDSLDEFAMTRSVSPHDYDLGFHLRMLLKLKKIKNVKIIGLPVVADKNAIISQLKQAITST